MSFSPKVLNFRTAIPREKKRAYFKCSYVGLKYLKSWFFVDLLSSIPFEFVEYFYRIISPEDFAQNSFFKYVTSMLLPGPLTHNVFRTSALWVSQTRFHLFFPACFVAQQ